MKSIDPQVNALFDAWSEATGRPMPFMMTFERWCFDAAKAGVTPAHVHMVVKERQKRIKAGIRYPECLLLRNFFGSEESIASVIEEAAALESKARAPSIDKGKAQVLKATARSAEPETKPARSIKEIFDSIRHAIDHGGEP